MALCATSLTLCSPLILRSHLLRVRPAAGKDALDERLGIQRHAPELQAEQRFFRREDSVFCPGVALESLGGLMPVKGHAHAAGVEEKRIPQAALVGDMGMPARHNVRAERAKDSLEL